MKNYVKPEFVLVKLTSEEHFACQGSTQTTTPPTYGQPPSGGHHGGHGGHGGH